MDNVTKQVLRVLAVVFLLSVGVSLGMGTYYTLFHGNYLNNAPIYVSVFVVCISIAIEIGIIYAIKELFTKTK